MELWNKERPILVAGAGISGRNAVRMLLDAGYKPILYDGNVKLDKKAIYDKIGSENFEIVLGELTEEMMQRVAFCAISPGIALNKPVAVKLQQAGVKIMSEISLAHHFAKGTVAAITGTNGKTTTTSLLGHIMRAVNPESYTLGNIGQAYSQGVLQLTDKSFTALELSAFQLETIDDFAPHVSVYTNLTPDHLDRFITMERYAEVKKKICLQQTEKDFCVINGDTEHYYDDIPSLTRAKVVYFSAERELEEGTFLRGDEIVARWNGEEYVICRTGELNILGRHNHENVLCASLAALCLGVPFDVIRRQVLSFTAVPHRIEYVCTKNGVRYYNDSKATNPDSGVKALLSVEGRNVLIAGGFDKGADYDDWVRLFPEHVKAVILMGQTAQNIYDSIARICPEIPCTFVSSMKEAVEAADKAAAAGDNVLLSPSCASWDMYPNFEIRGDEFKNLVREN